MSTDEEILDKLLASIEDDGWDWRSLGPGGNNFAPSHWQDVTRYFEERRRSTEAESFWKDVADYQAIPGNTRMEVTGSNCPAGTVSAPWGVLHYYWGGSASKTLLDAWLADRHATTRAYRGLEKLLK